MPGEGIASHIDRPEFGPTIARFTFMNGREIEFQSAKSANAFKIYTTPRSLYVMTGESCSEWSHQMRRRKRDNLFGIPLEGKECFSVTFRKVV